MAGLKLDDYCMGVLSDLGLEVDPIITFGAGNVPLGQVIPSQYMSLASANAAHY